jgi:hypothetical protein
MEWMALETLILKASTERVTDALLRVPQLMRHWPVDVVDNYDASLRADNPELTRQEWKRIVDELYSDRKDIFHGRQFHAPTDPAPPPSRDRGARHLAHSKRSWGDVSLSLQSAVVVVHYVRSGRT